MTDLVVSSIDPPVATLTLNRPERHNALVPALLSTLIERAAHVAAHPSVGAVVLAANGRSFSTGGDVAVFYEHRDTLADYAGEIVGLLNEAMLTLMRMRQPVIAAVHGQVTGGSLGLVLAADLVVATPRASFTPWYSVVGFAPDGGWTAILPERIGRTRASSVLLCNQTVTAGDALAWGLVNEIVDDAALTERATALAVELASMKTAAVKRSLAVGLDRIADALERERQGFVTQVVSGESLSGMKAFLDRLSGRPRR
jgi:2-(1,2-epoxy-1,2-dihydrophenyl)acetyl-CoA isomerase